MRKKILKKNYFRVSVAPMMDWTDRHCRYFHRQLSRHVVLYTEMVVADAIIHGPRERLLRFDPVEHKVALQLGGSDPDKLREASRIGAGFGYDEINLNVGCPSDRVQSGRFGACLMAEADLVATCFQAMRDGAQDGSGKAPSVTIKCRLGIDDQVLDKTLPHFIETASGAGCETIIIHARKAWLKGLSPKENRTVPPIDYDRVHATKSRFPHMRVELNGQLESVPHALSVADGLDGAMFGRAAYNDPWILTGVDPVYGDAPPVMSRQRVSESLIHYLERVQDHDRTAKALLRHVMGLYAGQAGARLWRRTLSEGLAAKDRPSDILHRALATMTQATADAA